ncbi:ABC transporter ATP-binding protein [Thermococcus sp. SY098]|uniref:ABC transporter ATP-binding protein n=1 Tax=Thermococcus sp. SY098 TaxID=3111325 RepID=UPI002D77074A|nr:ABC transporter ATP-binding protein [Thermococcus sp. SY098]WRS53475.1 ABC transporter ATP-binding protein [Thermococcus sp. SY098]
MPEILIKATNLTKIYGSGRTAVKAVDNVSLTLRRGEVVLLMGPSGSGKTTLLTLLSGLLRPTSGSIRIYFSSHASRKVFQFPISAHGWVELTELSQDELAKLRLEKMGFIFQHFNLLSSLTALENVMVPLLIKGVKKKEAEERAKRLLVELGLEDRLNSKPEKLSGGEQQRVSIARALITDPDIIIADEPTANLDSKNGREVIELIHDRAKRDGKGVIIATHDPRIVDFADRILYMEDGKIYEKDNSQARKLLLFTKEEPEE